MTIVACKTCGLVQRVEPADLEREAECRRCGALVHWPEGRSLQRTTAYSLAALALYGPANLYPILRMTRYGVYSENTVWDGCVALFRNGDRLVAAIVFVASILIPLCKMAALFALAASVHFGFGRWRRKRTLLYRILQMIGPWAMLDVFLLAILVALVKLKGVATVLPGPGLLAFAAVVVLTLLASASFDPRLVWKEPEHSS